MQRRRHIMKTLLVLAAIATAAVAVAGSGLGLSTGKQHKQARRHQPRLVVMEGVLQQDRYGSLVLDDQVRLRSSSEVRWVDERNGNEVRPAPGRAVRLAGQWYGGVFEVRHAVVLAPNRMVQREMIMPDAAPDQEITPLPE